MVSATRAAKDPDWAFVPLGAMFLSLSEMWHMSKPVKKSASFFEFLGPTSNMSKPVMTFVFKVLRNRLLRYILQTFPSLWWRSCSKCYTINCFGTYFKHVQTCDEVRVQSATQSTVSVHTSNMSIPVMTFVFATQSIVSVHTSNMSKPVSSQSLASRKAMKWESVLANQTGIRYDSLLTIY